MKGRKKNQAVKLLANLPFDSYKQQWILVHGLNGLKRREACELVESFDLFNTFLKSNGQDISVKDCADHGLTMATANKEMAWCKDHLADKLIDAIDSGNGKFFMDLGEVIATYKESHDPRRLWLRDVAKSKPTIKQIQDRAMSELNWYPEHNEITRMCREINYTPPESRAGRPKK